MRRYLHDQIVKDLSKKMVMLTGPRQVGKTFLAKQIMAEFESPQYLNADSLEDRSIILKHGWPLNADLLVFDEIHKLKGWKQHLKGVFDTRPAGQAVLVTGSARLEAWRQTGESLAGRYFPLRLHPLSVRELSADMTANQALDRLNRLGGFPEPFLSGSEEEAARWRNQYYTDLVREDVFDIARLHEVKEMRLLLEMLRSRTGSLLSYSSLAGDLQIAPNTVKKYIGILESLYIIFLIRPYHRQIARSLLREPKLYFYDSGYVKNDEGHRFENTCALALLKHVQYLRDVKGRNSELNFLRTKDGREVDFVVADEGRPTLLLEVKLSDASGSPHLIHFKKMIPGARAVQIVGRLKRESRDQGIEISRAAEWLSALEA
ncbi:MAG: ATP-binding protein [Candidatus Aminicenantes bacterium]|nr:ATP-binding protein [Candidatus Aminicenantes bacterium]